MNKICTRCKLEKNVEEFYFRNSKSIAMCKECVREKSRKYRSENLEKVRETNRRYYKEKWIEYKNDPDNIIRRKKIWRSYYIRNREKLIDQNKKWKIENRDMYLESRRIQEKNKLKNNEIYKLRTNISKKIGRMLKKFRTNKNNSIMKYLPYSIEELKIYLENKFDGKMNWENYGSYWHIDHIIPQSKLLFDSMEHPNFIKCWSLNNLRPLEASENLKKGAKYE